MVVQVASNVPGVVVSPAAVEERIEHVPLALRTKRAPSMVHVQEPARRWAGVKATSGLQAVTHIREKSARLRMGGL